MKTTSLILAVAMFAAVASSAFAQSVVRVPVKGPRQMREIQQQGIEVLAYTKYGADLLADAKQLSWLQTRNYPATVLEFDVSRSVTQLDPDLGLYHTYAEMESLITSWETDFPSIVDVFVFGTSIEGRNQYGVKISDNVTTDEMEPEVLYMGNLHARELMAVELPLRFAEYLIINYGVDGEITNLINEREIFVLPMLNPDGHVYVENNSGGSPNTWWRKNRRINANLSIGVDLNRNFGYLWGFDDVGSSPTMSSPIYRGTGPFSEPETDNLRAFIEAHEFTMWLSYHSYGELLLYPWGYDYTYTPDQNVFAALGDSLTETNNYYPGNPALGAIYITNGDSDDWGYGSTVAKPKVFAMTPEVNSSAQGGFGPADTWIQPTFDLNLEMNMRVLRYSANPYMVVGPWSPVMNPVQHPYANAVHRVSWSGNDPMDPNPTVSYELEVCENPSFFTDDCEALGSGWNFSPTVTLATGQTGNGYYFGNANNLFSAIDTERPFVVDAGHSTLTFAINYDLEVDWDYGYVEVSTDDGSTWTTIAGNITTTSDPNGNNRGNGFTGNSGGWVNASFSLAGYMGQSIIVRLSYVTDALFTGTGMTVDDLTPVPACNAVTTVSSITETQYDYTPTAVGTWRYRVRAIDAENHASYWSPVADDTAATLTAAGEKLVYRTQIGRNYPNPFNPITTIPFVVGGEGGSQPVQLAIFDAAGRRVATLFDGEMSAGGHELRWTGTNDAGVSMATGVYFARLVVGTQADTRKLVLLK